MAYRYGLFIPSSKLHTPEALVPQFRNLTRPTQDFVVQLRVICDSVLYAYLSRIADTAEKRQFIHVAYTVFYPKLDPFDLEDFKMVLDGLYKMKVFDPHPSDFPPYNLRVFLLTMGHWFSLSDYFRSFRTDPERSREFCYEGRLWNAFVATRYMRYLRALSNSRCGMLLKCVPSEC